MARVQLVPNPNDEAKKASPMPARSRKPGAPKPSASSSPRKGVKMVARLWGHVPTPASGEVRVLDAGTHPSLKQRIFIPEEEYSLRSHMGASVGNGMVEYLAAGGVGVIEGATPGHVGAFLHGVEIADMLLGEAARQARPSLTMSQASQMRRMARKRPGEHKGKRGVWITLKEAIEMGLPSPWYDPGASRKGKKMKPIALDTSKIAPEEERYASSRRLASNAKTQS